MMHKISRKTIFIFLILVFAFLPACSAEDEFTPTLAEPLIVVDDTKTQPPPEPVEVTPEQSILTDDLYQNTNPSGQVVTFWYPYTGDREAALLEIVEEFNLTNEWNITVAAEYQGTEDDIFDKMLTFMNTPEAPNLVVAYPHQAATYHLGRALIDLNPLVYSPKWGLAREEIEDFVPGLFYQGIFPNFEGIRLGYPTHGSMEVMYYNADWLMELGMEIPPTTPEEFKAVACAAAKQPYSGATAEGSIGYPMNIDATLFASWTFAFGGQIFDIESNRFTYESPGAIAAMQFIQNLFGEGCASQITERNSDLIEFSQGTALFTLGSSNNLPFYQEGVAAGSNHNWSVAPIPHTTAEPIQNIYGGSISISKTSPEAQLAAWLFLKFYTSPEIQAKWAAASDLLPARASAAAGLGDYFAAHPAYAKVFKMMPSGTTEPPAAGYDEVRDMVTESMYAIALGADVVSTLGALNADANAYLEQQLAVVPETPDPWAEIDPSGQTVIFWHQQPPARHAILDELIWKFNSTNKWGITVVAEYQEDVNSKMQDIINTSSEPPDLVEIFQSQAADLQLSSALTDMTSLVESIKWGLSPQDQTDFYPSIYLQDVYPIFGNTRLGFPPHRSLEVLYYNADWLAELKAASVIDFDGPPQNPDQFKAATCAAVSNPFSASLAERSMGYLLSIDASHFTSWAFAFGGDVFDNNTLQYSYNNQASVAAMNFLQELFNQGCIRLTDERFGDQADFSQGTLLFTVGSTAGLPFYMSAVDEGASFNWSVAPLPHITTEPVQNVYGTSLSMPKGTPESELATWLFVKYFTSPEVQAQWVQASNNLPVRASAAGGMADYFAANPAYVAAYEMLPFCKTEPSTPGYDFVRDMVEEAMEAIMADENVKAILDQLNEDANLNLAEQHP